MSGSSFGIQLPNFVLKENTRFLLANVIFSKMFGKINSFHPNDCYAAIVFNGSIFHCREINFLTLESLFFFFDFLRIYFLVKMYKY